MGWFRRSRTAPPPTDEHALVPVPVATAPALARTERALQLLATQSAQLHTSIVRLEHRVDAMSERMVERFDAPSHQDVIEARLHTAKVAAELSRLEINLASRLDQVRAEVRDTGRDIDLRDLSPVDTGF